MDIEQLRSFCLDLEGATEDVKWGKDLCFCVGEKMFCVTGIDQPGFGASFKLLEDEFAELTERGGIIPAPYVARYKWVRIESPEALTKSEWEHYVKQSHELIRNKLPKKVRDRLKKGGR